MDRESMFWRPGPEDLVHYGFGRCIYPADAGQGSGMTAGKGSLPASMHHQELFHHFPVGLHGIRFRYNVVRPELETFQVEVFDLVS